LGERPCTGIKRLFLAPDNSLGVGVHIEVLLELLPWEWVQLLNTCNGSVEVFVVGPVLMQCDIYLARTEDDAVDLLSIRNGIAVLWVWDDPPEVGIASKLFDGGATKWMTKKRLREEDDKR
jgi:hypothetical protein